MSSHLPFICTHFPFILHSCPLISFLKLLKSLPENRVQQMVIAKLSLRLRLSLNNTCNILHSSKEICHKMTERERERATEIERERKRASELDAKCYGNCRKQGTTGWISFIGFARSVLNVHNSICLVYAKFNGLSCMVPGYRFWGGLLLYSVSCTSLTTKTPAILKWLQPFWPFLIYIY